MCWLLQNMANVDWDKGLPIDLLSAVASGRDELRAMRGVSYTWQEGFESSVTHITVDWAGPQLPSDGALERRFPGITSLDLGDSPLDDSDLWKLAGLQRLRSLTLGLNSKSNFPQSDNPLAHTMTDAGLEGLQGLPLTHLNMRSCDLLQDSSLRHLSEMPLASLNLGFCGIADLRFLRGVPLTSLDLCYCGLLTGAGLAALQGMPLTDLDMTKCGSLTPEGLQHLKGLPLTRLELPGCHCVTDESLQVSPFTLLVIWNA